MKELAANRCRNRSQPSGYVNLHKLLYLQNQKFRLEGDPELPLFQAVTSSLHNGWNSLKVLNPFRFSTGSTWGMWVLYHFVTVSGTWESMLWVRKVLLNALVSTKLLGE